MQISDFVNGPLFDPLLVGGLTALTFKYFLDMADNMELLKLSGIAVAAVFVARIIHMQINKM